MDVLVTGATGFVGARLVPALIDAGHAVTVLVRSASRYAGPSTVDVVEGDLLDPPASYERAFDVDAAYYLVHSMAGGGDFAERDRRAARHFVAGAESGGVDRVFYLSGLGEDLDRLSPHLRSRREIESVLAEGTFALTTLRAAIIVGGESASFGLIRQLAGRLPVMVTPQWVETRCQPIAIDDVIAYLVGVLDAPETAGRTFEIGGPEVLTYREMLRRTGRRMGREPLIVPVPVLSPRLSAYWIDLVTDVPRDVAHELVEGLRNPVVVTEDAIRGLVSVDLTPFDEAVERALAERPAPGRAEASRA